MPLPRTALQAEGQFESVIVQSQAVVRWGPAAVRVALTEHGARHFAGTGDVAAHLAVLAEYTRRQGQIPALKQAPAERRGEQVVRSRAVDLERRRVSEFGDPVPRQPDHPAHAADRRRLVEILLLEAAEPDLLLRVAQVRDVPHFDGSRPLSWSQCRGRAESGHEAAGG